MAVTNFYVSGVSSDQRRRCHENPHLSRLIGKSQDYRSLSIIVILELNKCIFNLIQLVLGVRESPALAGFEYKDHRTSELLSSTHPDVRLGIRLENEFSHDSLSTVIQPSCYILWRIGSIRSY